MEKKILAYLKLILPTLENNAVEKGYLWINNPNTDFSRQLFFSTYEEGLALIKKYKRNNCYIGLATTVTEGYKTELLLNRNVIVVDIDEEDLPISEIYYMCKRIGLFTHMVINSGRGWHLYFKLKGSYPIKDIVEVNRHITDLFKADMKACSSTQIIRVPFTMNLKVNKYSSIVTNSNPIRGYNLNTLKNHRIVEFKKSDTDIEIDNIEDLFCFNQIVRHGASKGFRNNSLMFISTTCKYANLSEHKALQYAYEFNDNCEEGLSKNEIKRVVKSIYDNPSFIKPCCMETGQKLCSLKCKYKDITSKDIFTLSDVSLDDKVIGLTKKHIINYQTVKGKGKKFMLEVLTGTELTVMALLKVCNTKFFTKEDISDFLKISKPTISKALKTLKEKNIVYSTKQQIDDSKKPTELYAYNFDFEKYNKEIVHLNTNLFVAKMQKIIKDNDLKVAIALRYLMANNQTVTLEDISYLTGIKTNNIPKILSNLIDAKLIIVDKIKGNKGLCNTYQLFY